MNSEGVSLITCPELPEFPEKTTVKGNQVSTEFLCLDYAFLWFGALLSSCIKPKLPRRTVLHDLKSLQSKESFIQP